MSFLKYQKQTPEFVNNFLKYKKYIEFGSQTTVDSEYFDLRTLLRFVKVYLYYKDNLYKISKEDFRKIEIKNITLDDINRLNTFDLEKYIIFLSVKLENDNKTRNRKLASCKRLFEYLEVNNLIDSNPTKNMSSARVEKRIPKYLSLNESKRLLAVTLKSKNMFNIRNYAITCIFLNCSIRLSELTNIDLTDIKMDQSEKTIKIHGKGNKERLLYLDDAACEAINAYLEVRPSIGKDNKDYNALFLSARNKRISNRTVQVIIKDNLSKALDKNANIKDYKTHSLRHTGASLLYNENNTDIFVLKKILGHKSLEATQIYTHVSNKKLKDIMMNFAVSSLIEKNGGK